MRVTAGIFLASILLKEMRYLVYIRYLWVYYVCIELSNLLILLTMVTNTGKVIKRRTSSQRLVKAMYPILNYMRYKNRLPAGGSIRASSIFPVLLQ